MSGGAYLLDDDADRANTNDDDVATPAKARCLLERISEPAFAREPSRAAIEFADLCITWSEMRIANWMHGLIGASGTLTRAPGLFEDHADKPAEQQEGRA
jgi:hypothetical protein